MSLVIWLLLVIIGVFDAREYRIPNWLVLILLSVSILSSISVTNGNGLFVSNSIALFLMFSLWLPLYIFRIAAAGDVKLAAVLGYIIGWDSLLLYCICFTFSCIFVGFMYQRIEKMTKGMAYTGYQSVLVSWAFKDMSPLHNQSTRMPLAPVMIIALAMQVYISRN
ncbi:prepilin peptidase [Vibrio diazotrophicus]|uniref:prepilin peptidase n=1 Tax=Vibrio diazotrophicus TaxID=685 RepID=UPI0022AED87E|nr:prepilin peptidase [Vibrio diazotrophicus]MCZ4373009.1 prepilin peptidase [Vibrio diazotrophicus]